MAVGEVTTSGLKGIMSNVLTSLHPLFSASDCAVTVESLNFTLHVYTLLSEPKVCVLVFCMHF